MATVRYDASHEQIAEGGIGGIRAVLLGDDLPEIRSLLLCLDGYLDPYYHRTLPYEREIWEVLQELTLRSRDDAVIDACLQLLGDYTCMPLSILGAGFSRVSEHRKPEVRALLDRP